MLITKSRTIHAHIRPTIAILVKHQKRVLKHYEGQFFENQTLPLQELHGYTEIYRRVIYSKTAVF